MLLNFAELTPFKQRFERKPWSPYMLIKRYSFTLPVAFALLTASWPALAETNAPFTLEAGVNYALTHNRSLAAANQQFESAMAQADQASSSSMPRIDLSSGFYRTNSALNVFGTKVLQQSTTANDFDVNNINNPDYLNNYQTRLGLSMPLFAGGALQAASERAEYFAGAQAQQLAFHKQQVVFQTIAAYVNAHQADAQVTAQENAVIAAQKRLENVQALKKRGMAIDSDVMDAHVYVLRSQVALDEARANRDSSVETLKLTLGMSPDTVLGQLKAPSIQFTQTPLATLINQAESNRADLLAMDQQSLAASAALQQSQAGFLPSVNLIAAQEWNKETFGLSNSNNMVGIVVSMNLYGGGSDAAQVRSATMERAALEYQIADAHQRVSNEVRQAYRSLSTAEKRLNSEREARSQTAESLRIKSLRHRQGLEKTSDVLDAQVRADASNIAFIRASYDLIIAKAALLLAAGTLTEGAVQ